MENNVKTLSAITSLFTGVVIGLTIGVLIAPKSGEESREEIKEKVSESADKLKESALNTGKHLSDKVSGLDPRENDLEKLRKNISSLSQDLENIISKSTS